MTTSLHAPILWAQRDTILYVTIAVEEVKIEQLNVTETGLQFKGSTAKGEQYETSFEFFAAVDGEKFRRYGENTRYTELIIPKKEAGWWPRLLKDKGKVGWLKVNFDKWVDEDEQDENEPAPGPGGDFDLSQYMSQMGAGGNMPPDLDGFDADEDEDDDDVPDLEDADEADAKKDGEQKEEKAAAAETNGTGN